MPRALASLTLSFGLVSIPVRIYNATEPSPGVRFRLLTPEGRRIRQRYVEDAPPRLDTPPEPPLAPTPPLAPPSARPQPVAVASVSRAAAVAPPLDRDKPRPMMEERGDEQPEEAADEPADRAADAAEAAVAREHLLKGYEFEKGRFVTFTPDELQALAAPRRDTIDIVSFVPANAVDPVYHGKAYYLAPERRGARPYALLLEALRESARSAIATWAWRGRETIAEVRPAPGGLVLQQLHYAEEVRRIEDLHIEPEPVGRAELALALQLVEQNAEPRFEPERWVNEAQARIRAAIEQKVAGERIVETEPPGPGESAQVIDLMQALRASLRRGLDDGHPSGGVRDEEPTERKPARRAKAVPASSAPSAAAKRRSKR